MYLPWKRKSVANRCKNLGASTLTIAADEHQFGNADIKRVNAAKQAATRGRYTKRCCDAKIAVHSDIEDSHLSDNKQEESFRVIDRRPFTAEGELRQEVVEQEEREAAREAAIEASAHKSAPAPVASKSEVEDEAIVPPEDAPKRIPAFENLVRMLGSNAAMVLGAYADPRSGQPMIDPDAARELIDMLDALREKTLGNLSPEEDTLLLDLLGKLKMTYLEVNQAIAAQAQAQAQAKAKTR